MKNDSWQPIPGQGALRLSDAERSALRRLLDDTARAVGGAEATLWGIQGDSLVVLANFGATPEKAELLSVPVRDSLVGVVYSMGLTTAFGPEEHYNRTLDGATGTTTTAMVAAPVEVELERIGVLSAINPPASERIFDGSDIVELQFRARLIGIVVEHYLRSRAESREVDDDAS